MASFAFVPAVPISSQSLSSSSLLFSTTNRHSFITSTPLTVQLPTYRNRKSCIRRTTITQTISEPAAPSTKQVEDTSTIETDVLVIGSGISGSSLAYNLYEKYPDANILLTESRERVGGNVISKQRDGYTWEEGPNTFQPSIEIMRLVKSVGLENDLVLADSKLPRFVYWDKKLFALPMSPNDILNFKLLSPWGFVRAGLGAMGFITPKFSGGKDESVKEFISRHLGKEVFQKMIDPFVSGVYAGNPEKLCMSAAFKKIYTLQRLGGTQGIIEGAIIRLNQKKIEAKQNELPGDQDLPKWKGGSLGSFKNGLGMLPMSIAEKLGSDKVKLQWELVDLVALEDGKYEAIYNVHDSNGVTQKKVIAKAVCITTPSKATASILKNVAQDDGIDKLADIEYPTVWSITLSYATSDFKMPLKGFGNLIPRSMGIRTLGTIWSSALFPGRAPEGRELLLSYIGGAQDNAIKGLSEQEVVDIVDQDIKNILLKEGSKDVKPVVVGARRWERAIPQYNIGYWDIMDGMNNSLKDVDGLFVGGNYANGVAFGDCIIWGEQTAPKVMNYIQDKFPSSVEN